jgi:hypothetical protein
MDRAKHAIAVSANADGLAGGNCKMQQLMSFYPFFPQRKNAAIIGIKFFPLT